MRKNHLGLLLFAGVVISACAPVAPVKTNTKDITIEDRWVLKAKDQKTNEPISGVTIFLATKDGKRNSLEISAGHCITNELGQCSIDTKRKYNNPEYGDKRFSAKIEATKYGYKHYWGDLIENFVENGEMTLTARMAKITPALFSVRNSSGKPISDAEITVYGGDLKCFTNSDGSCSIAYEGLSPVIATKAGYAELVLTSTIEGGQTYSGTLKTPKEIEGEEKIKREQMIKEDIRKKKERKESIRQEAQIYICYIRGNFLRNEDFLLLGFNEDDKTDLIKEFSRRKYKIDEKLVKERGLRVGMSECELYASQGFPSRVNRSVGSWGVDEQNVYQSHTRQTLIYTRNGRVTGWQTY